MKTVLFVCRKNTGRSQIATALFNSMKNDGWRAVSAGTDVGTASTMQERALQTPAAQRVIDDVKIMVGVDISDWPRRQVTEEIIQQADKIIVMVNDDEIPQYFKKYDFERWNIPDPVAMTSDEHRNAIDDMRQRILALHDRLV